LKKKEYMAVEKLVEAIRSLTPEDQESVREFIEFLNRRNINHSSPFLAALDEFISKHPDLLTRLAQ
jgi:Mn-containing catalase